MCVVSNQTDFSVVVKCVENSVSQMSQPVKIARVPIARPQIRLPKDHDIFSQLVFSVLSINSCHDPFVLSCETQVIVLV